MIKFKRAEASDIQQEIIKSVKRAATNIFGPAEIPIAISYADRQSSEQTDAEKKPPIKIELSWPVSMQDEDEEHSYRDQSQLCSLIHQEDNYQIGDVLL